MCIVSCLEGCDSKFDAVNLASEIYQANELQLTICVSAFYCSRWRWEAASWPWMAIMHSGPQTGGPKVQEHGTDQLTTRRKNTSLPTLTTTNAWAFLYLGKGNVNYCQFLPFIVAYTSSTFCPPVFRRVKHSGFKLRVRRASTRDQASQCDITIEDKVKNASETDMGSWLRTARPGPLGWERRS